MGQNKPNAVRCYSLIDVVKIPETKRASTKNDSRNKICKQFCSIYGSACNFYVQHFWIVVLDNNQKMLFDSKSYQNYLTPMWRWVQTQETTLHRIVMDGENPTSGNFCPFVNRGMNYATAFVYRAASLILNSNCISM